MERRGGEDIQIRPAVILEGVSKSFDGEVVLDDVSFTLEMGKTYLMVGRNGSGKTTLLKLIAGILEPDSGTVIVNGRVGYVFQNPFTQIVGSTVEEDVAFGLENLGVGREEMIRKIEEILEFVELSEYRCRDPMTLSGGQVQRLAIASVLVLEPDVVLLDEPLSMLDPGGRREVADLLRKLRAEGKTLVVATHDFEEVDFADRVIHVSDGTANLVDVCSFFVDPPDMIPVPSWAR